MAWDDAEKQIEEDRKLREAIGKEASDLLEQVGKKLLDGEDTSASLNGDALHYRARALQRITALAKCFRNGDFS